VCWVAAAPIRPDRRHAGRYSAAEHRYLHTERDAVLLNSLKKLAVVIDANSSNSTPFRAATALAGARTKAGSLRLARYRAGGRDGKGARYGAWVSTRKRSSGTSRTIARRSSALRNVTMPEMEM